MRYNIYRANVRKGGPMNAAQQELTYVDSIELDVPMRVGEYALNSRVVRIDYVANNEANVQIEGSTFR